MERNGTDSCLRGCRPDPALPVVEFVRPKERDKREEPEREAVRLEGRFEVIDDAKKQDWLLMPETRKT